MRILLIEDEPRVRTLLRKGLGAGGFFVDESADGEEGLRRAVTESYDLVILDLLLPGRDGLHVLRELSAEKPRLPILILSARADLETKLQGFALGATDYLSKPFSFQELLARVRVQVRRDDHQNGNRTAVRVGELVLDLAARRAYFGDTVADLTTREFQLLRQLTEHAGEVISRERLLSEVWGYHFDPGSNVVEVCVRRLRKKLGPAAPIETVRHAGYRVSAS